MAWNTTAPIGSISVKANRTILQQNVDYIGTTMGNTAVGSNSSSTRDHFWNIDPALDGHHRFVKGPEFTDSAGDPDNPTLASGQGVMYFKRTSGRVEMFYKNTHTGTNPYQVSPYLLTGTIIVTNSFQVFTSIPANTYGDIIFFRTNADTQLTLQNGICKSTSTEADALAAKYTDTSSGADFNNLRFRGGTGLDLEVRTGSAPSGNTWKWYVTVRTYA